MSCDVQGYSLHCSAHCSLDKIPGLGKDDRSNKEVIKFMAMGCKSVHVCVNVNCIYVYACVYGVMML